MTAETSQAAQPLRICGLEKRFRSLQALAGIDLEGGSGEVVVLLGANGAGKSTLLRLIAGAVRPDSGEIWIGGRNTESDQQAARSAVGWVLGDEHSWYWRLSARENLVFFAGMRGLDRGAATTQADHLLDALGLGHAADRRVAEFTTGMKARLALARARLGDPTVIVLDEASRGLDVQGEQDYLEWLGNHGRAAILAVTHTLAEASAVAHRVIVLGQGRIQQELSAGIGVEELELRLREVAS